MAKRRKKSGGAVGGVLDPVMEGLFGGNTDFEDQAAYDEMTKAQDAWDMAPPDLRPVTLDKYEWQGDYTPPATLEAPEEVEFGAVDPRLADLALAGPSAMNDIEVDPRLKDKQLASLEALEELAAGGGMTAQDEANLNRILSQTAQADKGRRDAIMQNASARGMGGSGMALLAQLQSSQAATDRANQTGLDIAGMAEQRALDAMLQGGQLAGGIRSQDFGEQAAIAEANDAIAKFNAANTNQNSQFNATTVNDMGQFNATGAFNADTYNTDKAYDAAKTNTAYTNDAALYNHGGRQGTANANVDVNNQQTMHNQYTIPQTQFGNAKDIATGKSGAAKLGMDYWKGESAEETAKAKDRQDFVGKTATTLYSMSDERQKKDVKDLRPEEIDEFLQAVEPKRYRYKDPAAPGAAPGERVGFMLQDVQDTAAGKAITRETDDGTLVYDKDNLDGIILAALSNLAKGKKA
jgi:hypothetical protein